MASTVLGGGAASPALSPPQPSAAVGTHSTTGVVVSTSETVLVIARTGRPVISFTLTRDTFRDDGVAVGREVSVRYRSEGGAFVATAVTLRHHAGG